MKFTSLVEKLEFLSTPSARRATRDFKSGVIALGNFYPRPPRGGRLVGPDLFLDADHISIHALREEGDASKIESVLML